MTTFANGQQKQDYYEAFRTAPATWRYLTDILLA